MSEVRKERKQDRTDNDKHRETSTPSEKQRDTDSGRDGGEKKSKFVMRGD